MKKIQVVKLLACLFNKIVLKTKKKNTYFFLFLLIILFITVIGKII